jgi:hypothetical protein
MNRAISFFNLDIKLEYKGPIGKLLLNEFDWLPSSSGSPNLCFTLTPGFVSPPTTGAYVDDCVWVTDEEAFIDVRNNNFFGDKRYQLSLEREDGATAVTVYYDSALQEFRNKIAHSVIKRANWNYISRQRIVADNILYDVFEPIIHWHLTERNAGFLHASSAVKDGTGVVFTGWGGAGKTSTCVQLVEKHDWKFTSDDLTVVSANGTLIPYTKSMQIYPYNVSKDTSSIFASRGPLDRLQWEAFRRVKGKKGVRRRFSPATYFGQKSHLTERTETSSVFYLLREERGEISVNPESKDALAERAASTISHEFDEFIWLLRVLNAAAPGRFPSPLEFVSDSREVYTNVFTTVPDVNLIRIPVETTPVELADYVRTSLL